MDAKIINFVLQTKWWRAAIENKFLLLKSFKRAAFLLKCMHTSINIINIIMKGKTNNNMKLIEPLKKFKKIRKYSRGCHRKNIKYKTVHIAVFIYN